MSELSYKQCFAIGCDEKIPRHMLMCRAHWDRVPAPTQRSVMTTLRDWDRGGALRPYIVATYQAQLAVAHAEHRSEDQMNAIRKLIEEIEKKEASRATA